jgi:mono/diheme cytochrome c family protein
MKHPAWAAVVVVVALVAWPLAPAVAQAPAGQDPFAGSRVFGAKGCVKCHAVGGAGGKIGPDLGRLERPRSFYDLASAMWNHLPRMASRMQELGIVRPRLDGDEAANLIAFLYTLNYFEPAGNVAAGRELFSRKRCVVCHQVDGSGGVVGPNLDFLKQSGSPIFVAAAMWNHGPQMTELMSARGIVRPAFAGEELRDLLAYLTATPGPREGPLYVLAGRPDTGRLLFAQKRCVECHGTTAGARVAPELASRGVRRTPLEFAALMWNKAPAMLAAMRARGITIPTLRPEEMADIVAYLQSAGYFAEPGNVQRGWKLTNDKGCLACHAVYGERGKPAGDLTKARGLESPAGVLAALWNHALATAPAPGGERRPWPELQPGEMADLVALLRSFGRPR